MKNYYRIMPGQKSRFAQECFDGNFIGTDFLITVDLSNKLPENWRDFNREFISVFMASHPDKSKIAAGLACGALHTAAFESHGNVYRALLKLGFVSRTCAPDRTENLYLPGELKIWRVNYGN